jgi:hypothetical protein
VRLRCVAKYANGARNLEFTPGAIVEDETLVAFLLVDAPGCFEVVKAVTAPPKDKAVKAPDAAK